MYVKFIKIFKIGIFEYNLSCIISATNDWNFDCISLFWRAQQGASNCIIFKPLGLMDEKLFAKVFKE